MINFAAPLSEIYGIGPKFLARLKKLKIETVSDLLCHFPFRYEDFSRISLIAELKPGQTAAVQGVISDISLRRTWRKKMFLTEALVSDQTGSIRAVWFNQPYLKNILPQGKTANFAGKIVLSKNELYLSNPIHEIISLPQNRFNSIQTGSKKISNKSGLNPLRPISLKHTGRLVPIYPETKGLTSKGFRYLIQPILKNLEKIPEFIPVSILKKNNLPEINAAFNQIHFPPSLEKARLAKNRFAFEKLFLLQTNNLLQRFKLSQQKAAIIKLDIKWLKDIIEQLPFELTLSQKQSLWEILKDLQKSQPMNRLLQGDVGSGKTIVAALAALAVAEKNKQAVFMAPTEILAEQHYKTFIKFFPKFDKGLALFTAGSAKIFYGENLESEVKKNELQQEIFSDKIKIIIGTHALIQKGVKFNELALVVIDEQHRFGVKQRAVLLSDPKNPNALELSEVDKNQKIIEKELSYKLNGLFFEIQQELGRFCREKQYGDLLAKKLQENNLQFQREYLIKIDNNKSNFADFFIENKIAIELKAKPFIEKNDYYQMLRYLELANIELGLIVNFRQRYLKSKRVLNSKFKNTFGSFGYNSDISGRNFRTLPHFLSMSATPIPRTLALTVFGDLDLSSITELPKNRKNIITKIVAPANREKAYDFIRQQIKKGRQTFVICPRIDCDPKNPNALELSEKEISKKTPVLTKKDYFGRIILETKAVKEEYEKLKNKIFPDLRVAMLHGRMKTNEKEKIMSDFKTGLSDILVSTSVVEVGVDIPNASIMMVEGAERFGLAQLYQFRGRVGRGPYQSFCFLFSDFSSYNIRRRLQSIIEAKNGLELAEKDLAIRGPGEFLGENQTGMPDLAMLAVQNPELIKASRQAASEIIQSDTSLNSYFLLKEKLKNFSEEIHLE